MTPHMELIQRVILPVAMLALAVTAIAPASVPQTGPNHETLVTLHHKNTSAREIFSDLGEQAGVKFEASPQVTWDAIDPALGIDVDDKPFNQSLLELCKICKLKIWSVIGSSYRLGPDDGKGSPLPTCYSGPVLFSLTDATFLHFIRMYLPQEDNVICRYHMSIMFDPSLEILDLRNRKISLTEATDENGQSYIPKPRTGGAPRRTLPGEMFVDNGMYIGFFDLDYPPTPGKQLKVVKGTIGFSVQTASMTVEFPDVATAKNVIKDAGLLQVTFEQYTTPPGNTIKVHVTLAQKPTADRKPIDAELFSMIGATAMRRAKLLDADGRRYMGGGPSCLGADAAHIRYELIYSYHDEHQPKPASFSTEVPTEVKTIITPVEFHDLPLP